MATDERRDRENENKGTKKDENVKDLPAEKVDEEKEGKVKGGFAKVSIEYKEQPSDLR